MFDILTNLALGFCLLRATQKQCKRRYSSVTHINGFIRKAVPYRIRRYALHFAHLRTYVLRVIYVP